MFDEKMNVQEQVSMILDIANQLRGPFKEEEYEKVIIPMTICRRFECILEKTKNDVLQLYKKGITNEIKLKHKSGLPIYNTCEYSFETLLTDPGKIKENFKLYLNSFNSLGISIFTQLDFFKTVDKLADKKKLYVVIKKFAKTDLTIDHVSSMKMGYIMEEIIRKYSENASAGDHFTPREVIRCLTKLLLSEGCDDLKQPGKIVTLGDFACGTGGMLYEGYDMIHKMNESADIELFGQDNNDWYAAIALAETIIRGQNPENIKLVDSTLVTDAHEDQKMRLILMNPPFGQSWSKEKIGEEQYNKVIEQSTKVNGWYSAGLPQSGDMQMLFWQFALNKLQSNGRAAIICNASPLFSNKNDESDIRKWMFENDYVEAVIQFCPELFYNTGISIYALILNKKKGEKRKGKIQLINASSFCKRMPKGLGFKRNELTPDHIDQIVKIYKDFVENKYSKVLTKEDFYFNLVPCYRPFQRVFGITKERIETIYSCSAFNKLFIEDDFNELDELPSKTQKQVDKLNSFLEGKKLQQHIIDVLNENVSDNNYQNRDELKEFLLKILPEVKDNKSLIKGLVLNFSEPNEKGDKYYDKKKNVEFDPELKEIEKIPFKRSKDEYFKSEVEPFVSDAIFEKDSKKIDITCEINFNQFFYTFSVPEASEDILSRLRELSKEEDKLECELYGK